MSKRPRGRFAKWFLDPSEPDARKPGQPQLPKFKAGKKQDPSARPPKLRGRSARGRG
jgi:hypothetical protein